MNVCIDACTVERIKLMWPHERLVERSLSTDDLETFFGTIVVHCQYKPQLVALSGVLSAPYCIGGHIAPVAILHWWPYCIGGMDQAFMDAPRRTKCAQATSLEAAVLIFFKRDHDQLRPAGAWCAAAGNALAKRQSKAVEGGPRDR